MNKTEDTLDDFIVAATVASSSEIYFPKPQPLTPEILNEMFTKIEQWEWEVVAAKYDKLHTDVVRKKRK